ncbi:hypothetical protein Mgra_00008672 [Meloidogyne graminicola]|uniref:Uncharacterized protein n=1 Tax=Meloidogyne graminicola TaxID=189291 RepID=A0A8S9ZF14_9BILA|nr:hypothetical protein Mgra_00008672 [Meloidogyne graminicola]
MEDHQNYLPLSIENNKGIYKPKKEYYTGELFNNNNTKQLNYRSSSAERIGGITIVPIRREATLPARRFHSELRTRERNDDNYGYITKQQKTFGNNLYFDSTFDKRKYEERPQTNFDFWRDRYRMEAISEPNTNLTTSYTINYPNGNTTAAEYSSFQQNADNEGGIMKHFQHTKHQQNQREYREWHSGDKQQQQRRSAADSYTTMGTLRNSAEERQSRKAIEYNQKQVEGEHHRHYNGQNYLYYDSGNYKNKNKNEEKWQRNKSSERWYDGRKQREEYIDQRHYRKIRFCCFDIFWPPGGIKQTYYRPSPKQKINKSISQQPSPIPLEHRPFYTI